MSHINYEQKVLTYKGRVVFEKIKTSYFKRIPKIFQAQEACFMFINKGEFSVRTPDEYLSFESGIGLLAKCFNYFFETNKSQRESSETIELLGVLMYPEIVEELFQFDISDSSHRVDYNVKKVQIDGLLHNFKTSIDILLDNPELADESLIKNKLKEFILLICKTQNIPSELDFLSAIFRKNDTTFRNTINNNLYSDLSLNQFATLCGMSLSSFKRKFKSTFNESPKKYLLKMKLTKAATLLLSSDQRISNIAYESGFETISTFNRSFKLFYSVSPSDYRLSQNAHLLN